MASPLSDLDELVLKCRDEKAKNYIKEAVSCYKAGAFRSAIVSTWIAVSFDIIDKLKELSLAGDKEAEQQIETFEKARRSGDITASLRFERDMLTICRDKLEFISSVEYIDLQRLQEDRNRCAHPSMTSDGEIFHPSAELARMHIRSAVESLLQFPPAQGKYALETLVSEVKSDYFPNIKEKAVVIFENSPLKKARVSLIRSFIIILLKRTFNEELDYKASLKNFAALNAINIIHREIFEETLTNKLSSIIRAIDSKYLYRAIPFLQFMNDAWLFFDRDVKQRIELYVEDFPTEMLSDFESLFEIKELTQYVNKRVKSMGRDELSKLFFLWETPAQVCDQIINIYSLSNSFESANSFASVVIQNISDFSRKQIKSLFEVSGKNDQIKYSNELGKIINKSRSNRNVTDEYIDIELKAAGLDKFIKAQDDIL